MKSNTGGKNLEDAINELDIVKNINKVSPYNYSKETLVSYFPDKEDDINECFTKGEKDIPMENYFMERLIKLILTFMVNYKHLLQCLEEL